jgi:hypothetical protein
MRLHELALKVLVLPNEFIQRQLRLHYNNFLSHASSQ